MRVRVSPTARSRASRRLGGRGSEPVTPPRDARIPRVGRARSYLFQFKTTVSCLFCSNLHFASLGACRPLRRRSYARRRVAWPASADHPSACRGPHCRCIVIRKNSIHAITNPTRTGRGCCRRRRRCRRRCGLCLRRPRRRVRGRGNSEWQTGYRPIIARQPRLRT